MVDPPMTRPRSGATRSRPSWSSARSRPVPPRSTTTAGCSSSARRCARTELELKAVGLSFAEAIEILETLHQHLDAIAAAFAEIFVDASRARCSKATPRDERPPCRRPGELDRMRPLATQRGQRRVPARPAAPRRRRRSPRSCPARTDQLSELARHDDPAAVLAGISVTLRCCSRSGSGRRLEVDAPRDRLGHDPLLGHRQRRAEAAPRAAAERQPGVGAGLDADEPLGGERERLRIDVLAVVDQDDADRHRRAAGTTYSPSCQSLWTRGRPSG